MISTKSHQQGKTAVLTINSDALNASLSAGFKMNVIKLIDAGVERLILDLSKLTRMDKSGLRLLIYALKKLQGGDLVVCGVPENISRLINGTGLGSLMRIEQQVTTSDLMLFTQSFGTQKN